MSTAHLVPTSIDADKIRFTPFVEGKLRTWFRMINVRKDGFMSREDYAEISQRFVKQHKLDDKRRHLIYDWLVHGWDMVLSEHVAKSASSGSAETACLPMVRAMNEAMQAGKKTSEDDYVKAIRQLVEGNCHLAKESLERMVDVFFDVFDENQDGYISMQEMIVGLGCFGVTDAKVVGKIFAAMDTNKDGKISRDEYVCAWVDYIFGDDRSNPMVIHFAPHLLEGRK